MLTDALQMAHDWLRAGHRVALARVIDTWGSSPCAPGSLLVVNDAGAFQGSVSGGCVEAAVIEAAGQVISSGRHQVLEFGITDERAWEVGLACGGKVRILVHGADESSGMGIQSLQQALAARRGTAPLALLTSLTSGTHRWIGQGDRAEGQMTDAESSAMDAAVRHDRCILVPETGDEMFVQVFQRSVRLVIIGAVHIAQHLAGLAQDCSYDVVVVDPRAAFSGAERFSGIQLLHDWPREALARLHLDARTAVIALSHDPKLDDPALAAALASDVFYIGALGSRRNQVARKGRLRELGCDDARLDEIHSPIGLDIGASSPAEIAVAIMAEIIAAVRRKSGETPRRWRRGADP